MCSDQKAAMSGDLFRMVKWAILGICVTGMIGIFGLYKYEVKIVKMPGEPNVQINVPLLLMTPLNKID